MSLNWSNADILLPSYNSILSCRYGQIWSSSGLNVLFFLAGAIEKQKLVYILNRDAAARLTISSPLEAHKANTLVYHVVGVDVGFENPMFACLEMDYEVRRTSSSFAVFWPLLFLFCSSSVIGEHWLLLLSETVFIFHKLTGFFVLPLVRMGKSLLSWWFFLLFNWKYACFLGLNFSCAASSKSFGLHSVVTQNCFPMHQLWFCF